MVSGMWDCDTPESWYDCGWDDTYDFCMYDDFDEVVDLLNSGLSRSEALDLISKIEGEADGCEHLVSDREYFDSLDEALKFARSECSFRAYLALTIVDLEGEATDDPSRKGEWSECGCGDCVQSADKIDIGQWEDMLSYGADPWLMPDGTSTPLCGVAAALQPGVRATALQPGAHVLPHPNEIGWGGFNGPGMLEGPHGTPT